jgi:adenine-specific DNA-methyltransferase
MVCAEGRYADGAGKGRRAAIFIGPEFGTVSRPDLVEAAREAGDAGFDAPIAPIRATSGGAKVGMELTSE